MGAAEPTSIAELERRREEEHRLGGFRSGCGFVTAVWGLRCPRCGDVLAPTELGTEGRIVSFTVQTVPSEEFLNDAPYAYVVVDLDGGGRVTGWVPTARADGDLAIGDRVRLSKDYRPGAEFERVPAAPGGKE